MYMRQGLPHEQVEVGVGLSSRRIEEINWRQGVIAASPAIGGDPVRPAVGDAAVQLQRRRMPPTVLKAASDQVPIHVWLFQVEHAAIGVVCGCGDPVGKSPL